MLKRRMTPLWLTGSLVAVSACVPAGDFCDVVQGPIRFPAEVAAVVVQGAREEAVAIDVQNRYGEDRCPAWPS